MTNNSPNRKPLPISKDIFKKEIAMCKQLSKENRGKCNWGECKKCGVIPFLYKIGKGEFVEDPKDVAKLKDEIIF